MVHPYSGILSGNKKELSNHEKNGGILNAYYYLQKANLKSLCIIYDSNDDSLENYRDNKKINGCQGFEEREGGINRWSTGKLNYSV